VEETQGPYLFTREGRRLRYVRSIFDSTCERAGLTGITPLGGWSSLGMVERYAHLSPTHKAEAVERIVGNSPTPITAPVQVLSGRQRTNA
jgi:hypothetical protein